MARTTEEEVRSLSRRGKLASMLLRGVVDPGEMASRLGMDPGIDSVRLMRRDIKAIEEQWKQMASSEPDLWRGRELARLDEIEREAWLGFDRSQADAVSTRRKQASRSQPNLPGFSFDEDDTTRKARDGSYQFLKIILECIKARREMLGLDAARKIAHGGDSTAEPIRYEVSVEEFSALTPEERCQKMREKFALWNAR